MFFAFIYVAQLMSANLNNILVLIDMNFGQWKEYIMVLLGITDLDFAFKHDCLAPLTSDSTADQKVIFNQSHDHKDVNSKIH